MDFDQEEREMAEAIRLSLLDAGQDPGPPPPPRRIPLRDMTEQVIDLTDDMDDTDILRPINTRADAYPGSRASRSLSLPDLDGDNWGADVQEPRAAVDVVIDDDEEDEELRLALAMSLAETGKVKEEVQYDQYLVKDAAPSTISTLSDSDTLIPFTRSNSIVDLEAGRASSSMSSILGLSRAEMERERQERLAKKRILSESDSLDAGSMGKEHAGHKRQAIGVDTDAPFSSFRSAEAANLTKTVKVQPDPVSTLPSNTAAAESLSSRVPGLEGMVGVKSERTQPRHISSVSSSSSSSSFSAPTSKPLKKTTKETPERKVKQKPTSTTNPETRSSYDLGAHHARSTTLNHHDQHDDEDDLHSRAFEYPMKYPEATFRNTHIVHTTPGPFTIQIQDLISPRHLQKAIMTTFHMDPVWLSEVLPHSITQLLVTHWYPDKGETRGFRTAGKVTELHPPLNGFGTFHSKLMVLFYPTFCRIVVSSANLVPHDWEELVNTLYVQDFPLLPQPAQAPEEQGPFGAALLNYLQEMTVPGNVLNAVRCIDFSTAKVRLIPAVQGSFHVDAPHQYGISQLSKIMREKNLLHQAWDIEYQTSSLGKLTLRFLCEFEKASQGLAIKTRSKLDLEELVMPPIKVIYPTERNVQQSRNGELGAGTICFQRRYWKELTFPRSRLHDFECVGPMRGSLMHSKIVLGRAREVEVGGAGSAGAGVTVGGVGARTLIEKKKEDDEEGPMPAGWFYIGSANFTESAWGYPVRKPQSLMTPQGGLHLTLRNWELGILYMIESEQEFKTLAQLQRDTTRSQGQPFFGPLPLPFKRPVRPYTAQDQPWTNM